MKKIIPIFVVMLAGVAFAAPPPKQTTVIFNPKSDPEAFSFIPTPATCELHVVASSLLVWVRYEGLPHSRGDADGTTIYLQERVDQKPTRIVKFGGRQMPKIVGVSTNGSLLFQGGEEFVASGDATTRSSSDAATVFQRDIRHACPFEVQAVTSPSTFARRLAEDKTPTFTLPVYRKGDKNTMRELMVRAVPTEAPFWIQVKSGSLPSPDQLRHLWPVVQWDEAGFTIWNGTEWKQFKWDANQPSQPIAGKPGSG